MPRFSDVRRFDEIDSTNRWVAEQARGGAAEGLVAVAGMQSAGRGRLDRTWIAPSGSALLCTVLVRPQMPMARWHWLNLAMAVAAQDAVRLLGTSFANKSGSQGSQGQSGDDDLHPDGDKSSVRDVPVESTGSRAVAVKWPNDLIVPSMGDRKLAGILAEMVLPANGQGAVAVGIGLNVRRPLEVDPEVAGRGVWLDELICAPTKSLLQTNDESPNNRLSIVENGSSAETTQCVKQAANPGQNSSEIQITSASQTSSRLQNVSPTVDEVLLVLLAEFERQVAEVEDHPTAFLETYRQRCITVGREVRAMLPSSEIIGTASGIDGDGQLLVTTEGGTTHTISAADVVHIRPAEVTLPTA